jgi:peptide/nickel transport system substrate-binding protein
MGHFVSTIAPTRGTLVRAMVLIAFLFAVICCQGPDNGTVLKIGLSEEPRTLNIWLASDANSRKILSQIYQPLYRRAPDTVRLVPWLAEDDPVFDATAISYTVRLRPARWSDGSTLTSSDVAFTVRLIQEFRIPRFYSQWKFVEKIATPDSRTIRFYLKEPMALFLTRSLTVPIVQENEWKDVAATARTQEKPLAVMLNYRVDHPVGSGPFMLMEWREGAYIHMKRNPLFFGTGLTIAGRRLGPYVDALLFKIYGTSDVAILALKKGSIDMFWWGIQPGYLEDLRRQKNIRIFENQKSALYFIGFNLRKKPFNDVHLRRAVATLIDKEFIVSRILQGHGDRMNSIVPQGNRYWYCPDVPDYGENLTRDARIRRAYGILKEAGYTWEVPPIDENGKTVPGVGLRLPDGQPMAPFTILTPPADYDPHRAMSGMMVQEWLRAVGMPAYSKPMAFGALIQMIKGAHDFDAFILGYGKLSSDPDYLRSFFHSAMDKKRGWNMSGYRNPEFDRMATESSRTMDPEKRRALIWKMQRLLLSDVPYFPIYNPLLIEAVRVDRFRGWVEMVDGIGNIWSLCQVHPLSLDA